MTELNEAKVRKHFEEAVDQTGMTVEEILKGYGLTIEDVIEINDQTGLGIDEILEEM